MLGASITAETPDASHSLARSPARPSETSIAAAGVIADGLGQRIARLRHPVTSDQHLPRRFIVGESRGDLAAAQDIEAERGIADGAGHHDEIPGFARRCDDHPARGMRPKAVIEIISGPGVETVSPPSSGQP